MKTNTCIVHYSGYDKDKYSAIKDISTQNEERIRMAKSIREGTGGRNHHQEQCNLIPDKIDKHKHGIHLDPCYKKFTLICSQDNSSSSKGDVQEPGKRRNSSRLGSQFSLISKPTWVYPSDICNICKKSKVYDKKKKTAITALVTELKENFQIN